jgi:hypothetical protein
MGDLSVADHLERMTTTLTHPTRRPWQGTHLQAGMDEAFSRFSPDTLLSARLMEHVIGRYGRQT